jgi:hypothetical protein
MATIEQEFANPIFQRNIEGLGESHPQWQQYQSWKQSQGAAPPGSAPPGSTPAGPAASNINQQAQNAQTYSATPGAAPLPNTTNQGTQDVVRNSYLQRATQGTTIDRNDPNFRQQADAYAANRQRATQSYLSDAAERASAQGMDSSGEMEARRAREFARQGQDIGGMEAQLVSRELENRRREIQEALGSLKGMLTADQTMDLQRDLADIEAAIKREGLAQSGSLGQAELNLKDKLGTGGLNLDALRTMLQNQQFGQSLGFNIADREAYWNNAALQSLF